MRLCLRLLVSRSLTPGGGDDDIIIARGNKSRNWCRINTLNTGNSFCVSCRPAGVAATSAGAITGCCDSGLSLWQPIDEAVANINRATLSGARLWDWLIVWADKSPVLV